MSKNKWVVLAILTAKAGKEATMKRHLSSIIDLSRAEPTCLTYKLHQDINNSCQFFLYEHWTCKEDHEKQFEKPYIQELSKQIEPILEKPYQVIFANEIEPFS